MSCGSMGGRKSRIWNISAMALCLRRLARELLGRTSCGCLPNCWPVTVGCQSTMTPFWTTQSLRLSSILAVPLRHVFCGLCLLLSLGRKWICPMSLWISPAVTPRLDIMNFGLLVKAMLPLNCLLGLRQWAAEDNVWTPSSVQVGRPPPKLGRRCDAQPNFYGYDVQHSRWLKQLRRLHNYANWARVHQGSSCQVSVVHGLDLWKSILRAPGFYPSFQLWWTGRHCVGLGDPGFVPSHMPPFPFARVLCEVFECEVRHLESLLLRSRVSHRRWRHKQDPNLIFKETKRPPPEPVTSLLSVARAQIAEVDMDESAVEFEPSGTFDDTKPVQVGDRFVNIIHATDSRLYLDSVDGLSTGQTLSQSKPLGALPDLFAAFQEQWQKRWCRHDGWPHSHWDALVSFARRSLPHHPVEALLLTPELLRGEVSRKKKQSACGLDGVSRCDLLSVGSSVLQSLCGLFVRASSDGCWPKQCINGKVSSLAKTLHAAEVNQFRPITVFSMLYRCFSSAHARFLLDWADGWAHPDVHGNRKAHQTSDLWRVLVSEIQVAYSQNRPLSGLIADIEKSYNCLPRFPILAIALHCGVPFSVVTAWSGALAGMERRFKVRDSYSGACTTSTGLAEGCALSCFGMLLLDDVLHRFIHFTNPAVRVLSFVDNWDFLTFDPESAVQQLDLLLQFAQMSDLTVDRSKTFGWSTDATIRGRFRTCGIPVKHCAKDLGAHVAFSKQRTNHTVTARLAELEPLWPRLRASTASYRLKVRALRTVAWPRGLFGVSSAPVGRTIWLRQRRFATQALAADKAGVNPMLHLGLVESFLDPEFLAIFQTVLDARAQCPMDFWAAEVYPVAAGLVSVAGSAPTSILVERIQLLGIGVAVDGSWVDCVGSFHPGSVNFSELCLRLQLSWQRLVSAHVSHRSDFRGLDFVDVVSTRRALSVEDFDQQALFRLGLAGGLFTQDAHSHWNEGPGLCKWCHQPDSLEHRYFECQQTADLRASLAPDVCALRAGIPDAMALRGWSLFPPTHLGWLHLLSSIPSSVPVLDSPFSLGLWNHVFTDGSCLWQSQVAYRVAAWGAVLAQPFTSGWSFEVQGVLGAGPLPGLVQTAYRAELYALAFVLHHAAQGSFRIKVRSDCLGVVNRFHLLTHGKFRLKTNGPNADLWKWVLDSVARLGLPNVQVVKTAAHRTLRSATTRQEAWAFWNNAAADRIAKTANLQRSQQFWRFWEEHARSSTAVGILHKQVVALHLAVAERSVKGAETKTLDDEVDTVPKQSRVFPTVFDISAWDGAVPLQLSLEYGAGMANRIASWWRERTSLVAATEPKWVTFAHLYVDYQLTWGCAGPIQSGKKWLDSFTRPYLEPERNSFLMRVKWFKRALKFFWGTTGQKVGLAICRGSGNAIMSFIAAASIHWDEACLTQADHWLLEACAGPCTRGSKALKGLPLAKAASGMAVSLCVPLSRTAGLD